MDRLPPSPVVVEVGVGARFDALDDLQDRLPGARLVAVDVDEQALAGAPEGVQTRVDDVHEPRAWVYRGADLVFARRPPVELQRAIARLADSVGSALALQALKDEWADVDDLIGPHEVLPEAGGWRCWPAN